MPLVVVALIFMANTQAGFSAGLPVCTLFEDLTSKRDQRITVIGIYTVGDLDDALLPDEPCESGFTKDGFRWPAGLVLVFPRRANGESFFPGRAGERFRALTKGPANVGQRIRVRVEVRGKLRMRDDYGLGVDNNNQRVAAYGYGHSKGYAAEFLVSKILVVERAGSGGGFKRLGRGAR